MANGFTKVTNGAATKQSGGKQLEEIGKGHLTVGNHSITRAHEEIENDRAGLSRWIVALASAVLAIEKQRRVTLDDTVHQRQPVALDTLRRGKLVENDLVYRQTFVIRSYEAGFDKIASIETIANLFQVLSIA